MAESGRLQADPLFQGLTRPPMVMGVSYMFFILNSIVCLIVFIQTSNFIMLFFAAPVMHGIGYMLCLKEPRAIELLILRASTGTKCRNRAFHGYTNSYDIF
jgi:type IV secretion system protein VirB3